MAPRNRKVSTNEVNELLDALFITFDAREELIENLVKCMKADINSYFDELAENAQELRKNNNPLNDAEIISGRYKKDILKIVEKYFSNEC